MPTHATTAAYPTLLLPPLSTPTPAATDLPIATVPTVPTTTSTTADAMDTDVGGEGGGGEPVVASPKVFGTRSSPVVNPLNGPPRNWSRGIAVINSLANHIPAKNTPGKIARWAESRCNQAHMMLDKLLGVHLLANKEEVERAKMLIACMMDTLRTTYLKKIALGPGEVAKTSTKTRGKQSIQRVVGEDDKADGEEGQEGQEGEDDGYADCDYNAGCGPGERYLYAGFFLFFGSDALWAVLALQVAKCTSNLNPERRDKTRLWWTGCHQSAMRWRLHNLYAFLVPHTSDLCPGGQGENGKKVYHRLRVDPLASEPEKLRLQIECFSRVYARLMMHSGFKLNGTEFPAFPHALFDMDAPDYPYQTMVPPRSLDDCERDDYYAITVSKHRRARNDHQVAKMDKASAKHAIPPTLSMSPASPSLVRPVRSVQGAASVASASGGDEGGAAVASAAQSSRLAAFDALQRKRLDDIGAKEARLRVASEQRRDSERNKKTAQDIKDMEREMKAEQQKTDLWTRIANRRIGEDQRRAADAMQRYEDDFVKACMAGPSSKRLKGAAVSVKKPVVDCHGQHVFEFGRKMRKVYQYKSEAVWPQDAYKRTDYAGYTGDNALVGIKLRVAGHTNPLLKYAVVDGQVVHEADVLESVPMQVEARVRLAGSAEFEENMIVTVETLKRHVAGSEGAARVRQKYGL